MKRIIVHKYNCYEAKFYKVFFCTSLFLRSHNTFNDIIINSENITVDNRSPVTESTCELSEDLQKLYNRYNILERCELSEDLQKLYNRYNILERCELFV